jgi:hypothetical protein
MTYSNIGHDMVDGFERKCHRPVVAASSALEPVLVMKRPAPPPSPASANVAPKDVTAATERLFIEISHTFSDETLREMMPVVNAQLFSTRRYECALIPDLEAEYQALSEAWRARDIPRLKRLLAIYFQRREALEPEFNRLKNSLN